MRNRIYLDVSYANVFYKLSVVNSVSREKQNGIINNLTEIAHDFTFSPIRDRCALSKKHLRELRGLSTNDISMMRSDEGLRAVVLDKQEYLREMVTILAYRSVSKE